MELVDEVDDLALRSMRSDDNGDISDGGASTDSEDGGDSLPPELATGRTGVDELLESMFTDRAVDDEDARVDDDDDDDTGRIRDSEHRQHDAGDIESRECELELVCGDGAAEAQQSIPSDSSAGLAGADNSERDPCEAVSGKEHLAVASAAGTPACGQSSGVHDPTDPIASLAYTSSTQESDAAAVALSAPAATRPPSRLQQHASTALATLRIIAFDVGGKLFRCKEGLIRKHPRKRLNQVISCGCERIGHDTFFIDRNPQHFEVILDWYRTGAYVRHPLVNEDALREDAKYFDLYDELFPETIRSVSRTQDSHSQSTQSTTAVAPTQPSLLRVPPRPQRQHTGPPAQTSAIEAKTHSCPKRLDAPATASTAKSLQLHSPLRRAEPTSPGKRDDWSHAAHSQLRAGSAKPLRFCKTEARSVALDGVPVVYMVRKHEHLLVASVKGHGKLFVRVCDATGMQSVQVQSAVLFDSQSYFYLHGGRAKLQHCLLPGDHTYTFWFERDSAAATGCSSNNSTRVNASSNSSAAAVLELEVEFQLISEFRRDEELTDSLDSELERLLSDQVASDLFPASPYTQMLVHTKTGGSASPYSPYMFLPPRHREGPSQPRHEPPSESTHRIDSIAASSSATTTHPHTVGDRDAIAQQLFAQSSPSNQSSLASKQQRRSPSKGVKPARQQQQQQQQQQQHSAIQRSGAAIVASSLHAGAQSCSGVHKSKRSSVEGNQQAGKITVYRAAQLQVQDSPRDALADARTLTKMHSSVAVTTKYQDHQPPRMFR